MKFGKSLSERVREEWKEYAVAYGQMKKCLYPKDVDNYLLPMASSASCNSDPTRTTQDCNTTAQADYPDFWKYYTQSEKSVTRFYAMKKQWAASQADALCSRVEKYKLSTLPNSPIPTITAEETRRHLMAYQIELEFIKEFLSINYTAFGKILKKYDKRTFSSVREKKIAEIIQSHPFLDGTAMDPYLDKVEELMERVEKIKEDAPDERSDGIGAMGTPPRTRRNLSRKPSIRQEESTKIMQATVNILDQIEKSPFFVNNARKPIAIFKSDEIERGAVLGEGEFSVVREVKAFNVKDSCPISVIQQDFKTSGENMAASEPSSEDQVHHSTPVAHNGPDTDCNIAASPSLDFVLPLTSNNQEQSKAEDAESFQEEHEEEGNEVVSNRGFMKHHCHTNGSARYAIKELKKSLSGNKRTDGAIDLTIEIKFLSILSHPNVIKLCGISGTKGDPKSFLILDRLYDTLGTKIAYWKNKQAGLDGFFAKIKNKGQLKMLWNERLLAAYDVARAMKYLHNHEIIYRDLKPENIGFDVRGNAKIFDFGLAKELIDEDKMGPGQYKASGRTGTRRYMAPEVVLCKYYGKPVDVYSFAILLWETLSLSQPFKGYGHEKHSSLVVKKGKRPDIKKEWPTLIKHVLEISWDDNPTERPDFYSICSSIAGEFAESEGINLTSRTEHLLRDALR